MMVFFIWIPVSVLLLLLLLNGWLKHIYSYPITPARSNPGQLGINYESVQIPIDNDTTLHGWWIPTSEIPIDKGPTIILVHGWGRNVERVLPYIKELHPLGYHLLAIDLRNHGTSSRAKDPNMYMFSQDILAGIEFLSQHYSVTKVGLIGLSIGGSASILAASTDPRIKKVITIGAPSHPADVMRLQFERRHIPYFPFTWLVFKFMQLKIGINFNRIAPRNNIGKSDADFFIINGENDKVVPVEQAHQLAKAASNGKSQYWIIPGRGHSDCNEAPGYWEKLDQFLKQPIK